MIRILHLLTPGGIPVDGRCYRDRPSAAASVLTRYLNDLNLIRIGSERYEIPDAVVLGG